MGPFRREISELGLKLLLFAKIVYEPLHFFLCLWNSPFIIALKWLSNGSVHTERGGFTTTQHFLVGDEPLPAVSTVFF